VYIYTCKHAHIFANTYYIYIYICKHAHIFVHVLYMHICIYIFICVYTYLYMCIHKHAHIHTYTHTHICICRRGSTRKVRHRGVHDDPPVTHLPKKCATSRGRICYMSHVSYSYLWFMALIHICGSCHSFKCVT